jgi:hypothetical protein
VAGRSQLPAFLPQACGDSERINFVPQPLTADCVVLQNGTVNSLLTLSPRPQIV